MATKLTKGTIYETLTNGMAEYVGTDTFMGQTTFKFKLVEAGNISRYILPDMLDSFIKEG